MLPNQQYNRKTVRESPTRSPFNTNVPQDCIRITVSWLEWATVGCSTLFASNIDDVFQNGTMHPGSKCHPYTNLYAVAPNNEIGELITSLLSLITK